MIGEHMVSNSLYQYNGIHTKPQTVNHIIDYEVSVHVSWISLVNNISSTKIFHLCHVHIMVYYYYITLLLVIIWTLYQYRQDTFK